MIIRIELISLLVPVFAAFLFSLKVAVVGQIPILTFALWPNYLADRIYRGVLRANSQDTLFAQKTVTLGPTELTWQTPQRRGASAWKAMAGVERKDGFIFLWDSANLNLVIPAEAFSTIQDFERFFGEAVSRLELARRD
jgi:hypothetical protein